MASSTLRHLRKTSALMLMAALAFSNLAFSGALPIATAQEMQGSDESIASVGGIPFIENAGQIDNPGVRFYADTSGSNVFVTDDGLTYLFSKRNQTGEPDQLLSIKETFLNAGQMSPAGLDRSEAVVNYFVGDAANWKTRIPTYNRISLGEVWQGINVELKIESGSVEKVFSVSPYGDVSRISMSLEGIEGIDVSGAEELMLETALGNATMSKPIAYQDIDGARKPITVSYTIQNVVSYGFEVSDPGYDPRYALTIDPLLASTLFGTTSSDTFDAIGVDSSGNVFVAGATLSGSYPVTTGAYDETSNGNLDVLVTKFNSGLTSALASTYIGGFGADSAFGIALDSSDNVFVAGSARFDYPTTGGAFSTTNSGGDDVFVSKLSNDLTSLDASTFIGGTGSDIGNSIALSSSGDVYVAGVTQSSDFPASGTSAGDDEGFVVKLDSDLTSVTASSFLGGTDEDNAWAVAVDSSGNVFVAGVTLSTDFPVTVLAYDSEHNDFEDAFVVKLDDDLAVLAATFVGGGETDIAYAVAVDSSGNVFATGYTNSDNYPVTSGAYDTVFDSAPGSSSNTEVFVSKLDSDLSELSASTFIGSSGENKGYAIGFDSSGNLFVAGQGSTSYPTTSGAYDGSFNGGTWDMTISKLDSSLSSLRASTFAGGSSDEYANGLKIDSSNTVHVAGDTFSANFPVTTGAADTTHNGSVDGFVFKITGGLSTDSIAPSGTIVINGGAAFATSTSVSLTLSCSDNLSGCSQMKISVDGTFDSETFEEVDTSASVTLPSGDGTKTVKVIYRDADNNDSSEISDTIVFDTTAPSAPAITSPTSNSATDATTDISGTAEASSSVQVFVSGSTAPIGHAVADSGGNWRLSDPALGTVITKSGAESNANFGDSVAAGDVNGDGFEDVVVGAPNADNGATDNGEVRIFFGNVGSFDTTADVVLAKSPAEASANFGFSVAIGDINGDGFGDVIVGARSADNGAADNGEVRIFLGGVGSFNTTAYAILTKSPAEASANFGYTVAVGNVNGDGFDDILVAARAADNGATDNGEVRVFFGNSVLDTTADAVLTKSPAEDSAFFGESVYAGDFNNDGFDDIIIGALTAQTNDGEAAIFFGSAGTFDTTADVVLTKPTEQTGFGFDVSAGDVNGDGFDDAIIGTLLANNGIFLDNGEINVFFGGSGSFDTTIDAVLAKTPPEDEGFFSDSIAVADINADGFDDVITVELIDTGGGDGLVRAFLGNSGTLDTTMDVVLAKVPSEFGANFGFPVSAGDVNGDGFDDIIASAADADNGASRNGEVHIFTSFFTTPLADGTRVISAKAKDGAGNLSPSSSSTSIIVYGPALTNLSDNDEIGSGKPGISTAGSNVHIVWEDSSPNDEIFYAKSTNGGSSFGSEVNVSDSTGVPSDPLVAVNQTNSNIVYVAWKDDSPGNYDIFIKKSADGGATFGSAVNISSDGGDSFYPHIALSGTTVHAVWAQQDSTVDVFYAKSTDGGATFGTPVNVSNNAGDSAKPFVAIDSGGVIHIAWEDDTAGNSEILYSKSTDNGASFGSSINVSNNADDSAAPVIAISGSNVHMVWEDYPSSQAEILYAKSTNGGSSFGSSVNLSNNDGFSAEPYISASGSNLFVTWSDDNENGPRIHLRKSADSGSSFGSVIDMSRQLADAARPQSSMSGRDLYVVWDDGATGHAEIVFRKLAGISNNPPTSDAGADQAVDEGTIVTLDGSGSDPDGDSITVAWTQTAGPSVTLSNSSSLAPTFTAPAITSDAVLTFQLAIGDGSFTVTDTVDIDVNDRKGTLVIKKVDQDTGSLLSGSAFKITPNPSTLAGSLTVQDGGSSDTNSTSGVIRLANVEFGTYLIQETTVPSGYTRIVQNVTVSVHATQVAPTISIGNKLAGTPVTQPITIPAPDLNVTAFNAFLATGAKVGGITVDDVNDLPSAVLTGTFDQTDAPAAITFNTTAAATSTTQQIVSAFNIPRYPSPEDALAQNNIYVAPPVVINQTGSANKFLVIPVVEKTVSGMTLLVNQAVPVASGNATVRQVEMKFSSTGVATGVAFSFGITDAVPSGTPEPPSDLIETSALFLNVGFIGSFGSTTFSQSGAFQSTPKVKIQVVKTLDVDKLEDGCPDITLAFFNESTSLWEEVRNPVRDTTLDTTDLCGYVVEPDHFSKFAVGGVKISVQAVAAVARDSSGGGGGRGASVPGSTDRTTYPESYFADNPLARMQITSATFQSAQAGTLRAFAGKEVAISSSFKNFQDKDQSYAYIVMVTDISGNTVGVDYRLGNLQAGQTTVASISWIPQEAGEYRVRIFLWNALGEAPVPLSDVGAMNMAVAS